MDLACKREKRELQAARPEVKLRHISREIKEEKLVNYSECLDEVFRSEKSLREERRKNRGESAGRKKETKGDGSSAFSRLSPFPHLFSPYSRHPCVPPLKHKYVNTAVDDSARR